MSKFRPTDGNCLYVIADIHGMYDELQVVLNRILPLRKHAGYTDQLVFLGDYIDRRIAAPRVVDLLLEVKNDYPGQAFFVKGNHEQMLLNAIHPNASLDDYLFWMNNGGEASMIGYLEKDGSEIKNPYVIPRKNLSCFVPKEHIVFFENLLPYYEMDDYIFVHGGCDPNKLLNKQDPNNFIWDRSIFSFAVSLAEKKINCPWSKTIVTGHNGLKNGQIFIHDKFMMLDGSYCNKICVWELNSKTGFSARIGNKRLVKET